jgi:hypothetical protein
MRPEVYSHTPSRLSPEAVECSLRERRDAGAVTPVWLSNATPKNDVCRENKNIENTCQPRYLHATPPKRAPSLNDRHFVLLEAGMEGTIGFV